MKLESGHKDSPPAEEVAAEKELKVEEKIVDAKSEKESKLAADSSDSKAMNDILKVCIRCSACEFMCNSLRSMGEHINNLHSEQSPSTTSISPPKEPEQNDDGKKKPIENRKEDSTEQNCVTPGPVANIKEFQCSTCDCSYDMKWKLSRHCNLKHPSKAVDNAADETTPVRQSEHSESETGNGKEEARNVNRGSLEKKHFCSFCGNGYCSQSSLKRHMADCLSKNNESAKKKNQDISHLENEDLEFVESDNKTSLTPGLDCKVCGRVLSNRANLNRHVKNLHKNASPTESPQVTSVSKETVESFECDVCNLKFPQRFTLNVHQKRFHSAVNPPEKGIDNDQDNREMKLEPTHRCFICERDFVTEEDLDRHNMKRHVDNDTSVTASEHSVNTVYSCKICRERVIGSSNLEKHIENFHPNIKRQITFVDTDGSSDEDKEPEAKRSKIDAQSVPEKSNSLDCSFCDESFGSKSSLYRHKKAAHF
jgi:Zinc finger, C2H2 type